MLTYKKEDIYKSVEEKIKKSDFAKDGVRRQEIDVNKTFQKTRKFPCLLL